MGSQSCRECGNDVSERARFCEHCGAPLRPEAEPLRAPEPLAEKILRERSAIEGERKQVTVMFADIVRSMDLTRELDTERWGLVLDRFLAIACRAIHELEGTVNQFTGDGLMAVFGAPVAHEDHARRACLAALQLQRELEPFAAEVARRDAAEFRVRCGLNSGEVIVGQIGDDLHMAFAPIGNTSGMGKRMESLAPEGSTAVSSSTASLVEGEFELRELGEFEVKGADEPQRVYELLGPGPAQSRLDAAAAHGLSPFVGRDAEQAGLEAALERALAGDGRIVGLVGEPGVGKSRLCREFVRGCRDRGLAINSGSALAHGRAVPLLPVLAMFRDFFGIQEGALPKRSRERIEAILLELDADFADELPLIFEFLGVSDPERQAERLDPDARKRRLLAFVGRLVEARSRREPGVIVLEDLHWLDEASAEFVAALVEAAAKTRTLLVATFRPEFEAAWHAHPAYERHELDPLDEDATEELLRELLGNDPSLDELADSIRERAAGNPFFVEELVRALAESGHLVGERGAYRAAGPLEEVTLPPTVQAVLAARIDRLTRREKALVQTMSVIGREVPEPVLREVAELGEEELAASVEALEAAQFLVEVHTNGHRELAFKHPLTQEVAYESQLSTARARAHAAVANAIERVYPEGLDERAALLAHHAEAADEMLKAARWHARAAGWISGSSPADGMRHWRRVREITDQLGGSGEADDLAVAARVGMLALAWRLGLPQEEIAAIHEEGERLSERRERRISQPLEDERDEAPDSRPNDEAIERSSPEIHDDLGALARHPGDGAAARRAAADTETIRSKLESQSSADVEQEVQGLALDMLQAAGDLFGGRERQGAEALRSGYRRLLELARPRLVLEASSAAAYACWVAGSPCEGIEFVDRALELADDDVLAAPGLAVKSPYAQALWVRALCADSIGSSDEALRDVDRARDVAQEQDDPECVGFTHECRSRLLLHREDVEAAHQEAERALEVATDAGNHQAMASALASLVAILNEKGEFGGADEAAANALAILGEHGAGLLWEPDLLAAQAVAQLGLGDSAGARAAAERAVEIAERRSLKRGELLARLALARVLAAVDGDDATARIHFDLQRALDLATEHGYASAEARVRRELAALPRLRGDEGPGTREEEASESMWSGDGGRRKGDRTEQLDLDIARAGALFVGGREREAGDVLLGRIDEVIELGEPGRALTASVPAALAAWTLGSPQRGLELVDRAISLAHGDIAAGAGQILKTPYGNALWVRGLCAAYVGRGADAEGDFRRSLELALEYQDTICQESVHECRGFFYSDMLLPERAVPHAERAVEICERSRDHESIASASATLARALNLAGEFRKARDAARQGLAIARERRVGLAWEPFMLAALATADAELGESAAAHSAALEAVEIARTRSLPIGEILAQIALAQTLLKRDSHRAADAVDRALQRAHELNATCGYHATQPAIHRQRAQLARIRGDAEAVEREERVEARMVAEIMETEDESDRQDDATAAEARREFPTLTPVCGAGATEAKQSPSGTPDHPAPGEQSASNRILLDVAYAATLFLGGRERQGLKLHRKAYAEAESLGDLGLLVTLAATTAYSECAVGDLREGFSRVDHALALAGDQVSAGERLLLGCPYGHCLWIRGFAASQLGRWTDAARDFESSIALARERGDAECETFACLARAGELTRPVSGETQRSHRDREEARLDAERAMSLAQQFGNELGIVKARIMLAIARAEAGEHREAADEAEAVLRTARERRLSLEWVPEALAALASARLGLGEVEGAREAAEEAVGIAEERSLRHGEVWSRIALADVLMHSGRPDDLNAAGKQLERALALATECEYRRSEPRIHRELARLARRRGYEEQAEREEAEAERILAALEAPDANVGSRSQQVLLDLGFATSVFLGGRERDGLKALRSAYRRAAEEGDRGLLLTAAGTLGFAAWVMGFNREGLDATERALADAQDDVAAGAGLMLGNPFAHCLWVRASCASELGMVHRAERDLQRCIELAQAHRDLECEIFAHVARTWQRSRAPGAIPDLDDPERALDLAERAGSPNALITAYLAHAVAAADVEEFEVAHNAAERALTMIHERRLNLYAEPYVLAALAGAELGLGQADRARAIAQEAVAIAEERSLRWPALIAQMRLVEVLMTTGEDTDRDAAEGALRRALELARVSEALIHEPRIHAQLAVLARMRGEQAEAELEDSKAERILAEISLPDAS